MQLHLVLVALVQQALCAHQVLDAAETHKALQTERLDTWVESIAAKRQLSKDAVRANVRAVKYYLGPQQPSAPAGAAAGGGEHAQLQRRDVVAYPRVHLREDQNDDLTNDRLQLYHATCADSFPPLANSPHTPAHGIRSFWRAARGGCRENNKVRIFCKMPTEFAPAGWDLHDPTHIREVVIACTKDHVCETFRAYGFPDPARPIRFGGCVEVPKMKKQRAVNNVPTYEDVVPCPIKPETKSSWDVYGYTADSIVPDWTLFTGMSGEQLHYSHSSDFMFSKFVRWRGKDPDYQPWLKIASRGTPATVYLYSHVL